MYRKYLIALSGILCCSAAFLHAEKKQHSPSDHFSSQKSPSFREITPSAGPRVSHGVDVFITADFIYWTTRQDGMGFVMSGFGNGIVNPTKGQVHHIDWDFDPGFKAGIGFNLSHDGWDVFAQYTWLHTHPSTASVQKSSGDPSRLQVAWNLGITNAQPASDAALVKATATWDNHFNVIDLELGRNYFISQFLTLRPYFGLKGSWQDQDFKVTYLYDESISEPQTTFLMKNDMDFWGIGLRTGLNTGWFFYKNFSLFADFALSALWSNFEIERKDRRLRSTAPTNLVLIDVDNDFHTIKAVLEFDIGLRYDLWFYDDEYHLGFQAGWEEQIWFSHNQLLRKTEEGAHGDLILQGLTVKIRFDF